AGRSARKPGKALSTHQLCPSPDQAATHVGLRTAQPGNQHSRRGPAPGAGARPWRCGTARPPRLRARAAACATQVPGPASSRTFWNAHVRRGSKAGKAFRKFLPLFDRVLVERCAAETVTKGGIMIPEKAQGKVLQATVVAVGSGAKGKNGEIQPVSVKVGEKVLLPEYGGTKIVLDDKDYYLFRDGDILGKYLD
uniref:10 kDa heat shock protein, mitochondrial n=1 Tax=Dromaius novaehollandiae TaxID=8790 RepID=A0A8C4J8W4_DRONO